MRLRPKPTAFIATLLFTSTTSAKPEVKDTTQNVIYRGNSKNGVDSFLNIPFGQDTGGSRRFLPSETFIPTPNTVFNNKVAGAVCPQDVEAYTPYNSNATNQSEDCLNLLIAKPSNAKKGSKLPVMAYIYGGSQYLPPTQSFLKNGQFLTKYTIQASLMVRPMKEYKQAKT